MKPIRFYLSRQKGLFESMHSLFGFYPNNIYLYKQALKHRSASDRRHQGRINNERLEYLGDSILNTIVADYLFRMFPTKSEGFLTEMRSRMVSRAQLNKLGDRLGLHKLITYSQDNSSVFKSMSGDAFEALVGAIYLDKGFRFARKVIIKRIIQSNFDLGELQNTDTNYKSRLFEWAQREKRVLEFSVRDEIGTGYKKQYVVSAVVDGSVLGTGQDFSIKGAEQHASMKALLELDNGNGAAS